MPNDPFFWAVDKALIEFENAQPDGYIGSKHLDILVVGEYLPDVIDGVVPPEGVVREHPFYPDEGQ